MDFVQSELKRRGLIHADEQRNQTQDQSSNGSSETPERAVSPSSIFGESENTESPEDAQAASDATGEAEADQQAQTEVDPDMPPEEEDNKAPEHIKKNIKNLRGLVKKFKDAATEKEAAYLATQAELEKYKTGEVLPQEIVQRESRIAELEKYEKIVSLRTSPEYQNTFVKPLTQIKERLGAIAQDYHLPPEVINQAVNIQNEAELNRFLSNHFDGVGALEVKTLINNAKGIQADAFAAEQQPAQALAQLMQEQEAAITAKRMQNKQAMADISRSTWGEALANIKKEGKAHELIYKEGDPEHNQKFVDPVVGAAAGEYGKLVSMLAEHGLEQLPKDLAYALSRMTLLAHASAVAIGTRDAAMQRMDELNGALTRKTSYVRPSIGTQMAGRGGEAPTKQPMANALDSILSKVVR